MKPINLVIDNPDFYDIMTAKANQRALHNLSTRKYADHVEQGEILKVIAISDQLEKILEDGKLENRLNMHKGDLQKVKTAKIYITNVLSNLFDTMQDEQLKSVARQLGHLCFIVDVKGSVPKNKDKAFWRFMSYEQLNMCMDAIQENCLTCMADKAEQRKCKYAKLMDSISTNKICKVGDGCGYMEMWSEEEIV